MSVHPDFLAMTKAALGASTVAPTDELSIFYIASARLALTNLAEEQRTVETLVRAREEELARRLGPKQLTITSEAP